MEKKDKKRLMILIWDMGIGGVQKRVKDIVIDIGQNFPDWEVFLLIKRRLPSYHIKEIKKKTGTNIHYFFFTGTYERSKSAYALIWIIKNYLYIKPHVTITFLDHLSIIMVTLKHLFFWQKTKLVLNEGILTSDYLKIYRKKVWLWKFLVKLTYKHSDKIIVPTKAIRKDLAMNFKVPEEKIAVINNWTLLKPTAPVRPVYDLIFIGRFAKEKNPLALIEIIEKLQDRNIKARLALLGSGKLKKIIRQSIKVNGLEKSIKILGFTKDVVLYLRKSKILILTTLNEGMPNVVLEAAMCQVPTVTIKFPGAEEVILDGKTGYICNSFDAMVKKIEILLKNSDLLHNMERDAQENVSKNFYISKQKEFISTLLN